MVSTAPVTIISTATAFTIAPGVVTAMTGSAGSPGPAAVTGTMTAGRPVRITAPDTANKPEIQNITAEEAAVSIIIRIFVITIGTACRKTRTMKTRIKHIAVWLGRIAYCRGFGIQSPSAYAFVRYVINEHYPYYAYAPLAKAFPSTGFIDRKLMKLCMRVANHLQPRYIIDQRDKLSGSRRAYFRAGAQEAGVMTLSPGADAVIPSGETGANILFRLSATDTPASTIEYALGQASTGSILIIDRIHANRQARRCWKRLTDDPRTGISYDLYYCGIVMFDKSKHKHNYIINF